MKPRRARPRRHRGAAPSPVHDFLLSFGAVPDDPHAAQYNTAVLNHTLRALKPGDTLFIPPRELLPSRSKSRAISTIDTR